MAKRTFKIEPTAQTMAQLSAGIKKEGSRILVQRALANASVISREIGIMLVKTFNDTPIARSLRGQGPEDLQAHFGLNNSTANALVDGMAGIIQSSVNILSRTANGILSINIRAVRSNWESYLNLPGAQYISSPSNITIPVLKWLLIDPSIDIGQAAFDIVFKGEDAQFDVQINRVSRSGRAIMVSLGVLGGGGGYVLPSIISGNAGQNFIELALGQPDVAKKAANILLKKVN